MKIRSVEDEATERIERIKRTKKKRSENNKEDDIDYYALDFKEPLAGNSIRFPKKVKRKKN
jgi:hypothetical protein